MRILKGFFKFVGVLVGLLAVTGVVLYALGARLVLDGGGVPHVRFPESSASREQEVEAHRDSQRATTASSPLPVATPEPTGPAPAGPIPLVATVPVVGTYWREFRGPDRDGHYRGRLLTDWPASGLKPLWKQPIGEGYASFAVDRQRAVTIEQRGEREIIAAYDVLTGRELWTNGWAAAFREWMGGDGPRATPTIAQGLVYALGAEGELRCLDLATGRVVWRTNILEDADASNVQWGMAASPLVVDDTVVVHPGGPNGKSVMAYDRRTGAKVWASGSDQAGYAAPMLVTLAGVRQILVFSAARLMGITADRGALLWDYPWRTQADINASQPILLGPNRVFLSSGYGVGAAVIEIAREEGTFRVREIWRNTRLKNRFNSSVLHEGFLYGFDESILACVDAATGDLKWKAGRYGYGQVLLADGHLIVLTEEGDLVLLRATPAAHQELARFSAIEGKTWNQPTVANGILLVRNLREMAAFDLSPDSSIRR